MQNKCYYVDMNQDQALEILKKGHSVFLTGAPGAGKTFLLNKFIDHLRTTSKVVAITASTGIAATHMNGVTIHSWSGLGIKENITDQEIKGLMKRRYLFKRLRKTDVLIIDEVSMLKASQFDAIDKICQYFKASFMPFGGIQLVLSGDFFQLPPIQQGGEADFITESYAWKKLDVKVCYLEGQFRHSDEKLAGLLASIRDNDIELSKRILAGKKPSNSALFASATKLYTHNVDVDFINAQELAKIDEQEVTYQMQLYGKPEVADILKKSCLSPETLVLKKGAQVMFIKNNFEEGYVNGTQGVVTDFDALGMPIVQTLAGEKVSASKASWKIEDEEGKTVAEINQIPLRLAWAITVHKSQGMNLDSAQIDLSRCFVKGMGYVALSRLRSFDGLNVIGINDMAFRVHEKAVAMDEQFKLDSKKALKILKA
ncbi:MAG: helicase [Candidatus Staskawiczbacteria bacterium]|nr:helicase [Candidatus Staskawiczbacteria bacterium]